MNTDQITGLVRSALLYGSGYFVAKGIVDGATATVIVTSLTGLFGAGWSLWSNRNSKLAEPKKLL